MIRNYLTIAWRNLTKNKVYSSINIVGLAAGMAVALLIGLWIWDELSFNKYFQNYDRLAHAINYQEAGGQKGYSTSSSMAMGTYLHANHEGPGKEFKRVAFTSWKGQTAIAYGEQKLSFDGYWVEEGMPGMLGLRMLAGDRDALADPSSILIDADMAKELFRNESAIGKVIRINNRADLKVAGVYEVLPRNTEFYHAQMMLPWKKYMELEPWRVEAIQRWADHNCLLYVEINEGQTFEAVTRKLAKVPTPHIKEFYEEFRLLPMDQWHLYTAFEKAKIGEGRIQFVWLFGIVGAFVLLLACINFMNLATARSEKRAKEVGIRKSIGSVRGQLIGQFLSESVLMASLALLLALGLVLLTLPAFNTLADKAIELPWANPVFWALVLGFTLFTGLLSGIYPAFYLSGFQPVQVLKGTFRAGRLASLPRKVLVVVQFTVSVTLIIGTVIVYKQIQYAKNRPVGYDQSGLIQIEMSTPELNSDYDIMRQRVLASGGAAEMAASSSPTTGIWSNTEGFQWKGRQDGEVIFFGNIGVTHDYGKTINWTVIEGRDFSRTHADSFAFILSENAVKRMRLKNPIGEMITHAGVTRPVIGVVKNMVMDTPYATDNPPIFILNPGWRNQIIVRLKPGMPVQDALARVKKVFEEINPSVSFAYKWVDEEYAWKFKAEERIGNLATVFAALAIFISCLGLFGLASFVAEQRTKEIGVRKVLGASVFGLWRMLSRDFVALVLVSCGLAVPLAWYFLSGWLENYEYRTTLSWWVFAAAVLGALGITLATVSFQAIKAALANPVKSLRTE